MTPIANCPIEFRVECPKLWENLNPTPDAAIRCCGTCRKNVHLCRALEEVHHHATLGNCIAIPHPEEPSRIDRIGEVAFNYSQI